MLAARFHPWLVPVKYGLAVGLAAAAAERWVPQDVISAAFVAVLCCRPAVSSAVREAGGQFLASALGIGLAALGIATLGAGAVSMGLAATAVLLVANRLGWPFGVTVVALFSVVYMNGLLGTPWESLALVRVASVGLGVASALVVNLAAAPLLGRVNMAVRLADLRGRVQGLLAQLAVALGGRDAAAIAAAQRAFAPLYQAFRDTRLDLDDLRLDARVARGLLQRPDESPRERTALAAANLEMMVHHAQDIALSEDPAAAPVLELVAAALGRHDPAPLARARALAAGHASLEALLLYARRTLGTDVPESEDTRL